MIRKNIKRHGAGPQSQGAYSLVSRKGLPYACEGFTFDKSVCSWPSGGPGTGEEAIPVGQVVREAFLEKVGFELDLEG